MKVGVVGGGIVGRATARTYLEWVDEVRVYDVVDERATHNIRDTLACDIVFVCLPTPQKKDSLECDISFVEEFFVSAPTDVNYVLRSTVPIGTTRRLAEKYGLTSAVHSPEFLTARCAEVDSKVPARTIVGTPGQPRNFRNQQTDEVVRFYPGNNCSEAFEKLCSERFPGVPLFRMSSDESEAVKLFTNSFFAVKVSYFNEIRQLSDKCKLNWEAVMMGVLSDGRISHYHTRVPGPDGKYGFGNGCLPKDLANLIHCLQKNDCSDWVTSSALNRNIEDRERQRSNTCVL